MRRWLAALLFILAVIPASADKIKGVTTLADVQPAGTTDTKDKKKQQYDFTFEAAGHRYTCRTSPKTSVKATEFIVGSSAKYEVDSDKVKLKTSAGKEVKCTAVRVEVATPAAATTQK